MTVLQPSPMTEAVDPKIPTPMTAYLAKFDSSALNRLNAYSEHGKFPIGIAPVLIKIIFLFPEGVIMPNFFALHHRLLACKDV